MTEFDRFIIAGDAPVAEFSRACEETANVKFILAERKISELLKLIATSEKLSAAVARACVGFDFAESLKSSRIRTGKRWSLLPPVGRRELIAFAVNLFYAFDVGAVPLQDFLSEYFYSANGVGFSFSLFAHSIVMPLRDSLIGQIVEEAAAASVEDLEPNRAHEYAEDMSDIIIEPPIMEEEGKLPEEAVYDILDRLADICDLAKASGEMTDVEIKDLYAVAGELASAVKRREGTLIRSLMTGFAAVIRAGRMAAKLGEKASELDETLRHFGI